MVIHFSYASSKGLIHCYSHCESPSPQGSGNSIYLVRHNGTVETWNNAWSAILLLRDSDVLRQEKAAIIQRISAGLTNYSAGLVPFSALTETDASHCSWLTTGNMEEHSTQQSPHSQSTITVAGCVLSIVGSGRDLEEPTFCLPLLNTGGIYPILVTPQPVHHHSGWLRTIHSRVRQGLGGTYFLPATAEYWGEIPHTSHPQPVNHHIGWLRTIHSRVRQGLGGTYSLSATADYWGIWGNIPHTSHPTTSPPSQWLAGCVQSIVGSGRDLGGTYSLSATAEYWGNIGEYSKQLSPHSQSTFTAAGPHIVTYDSK